MYATWLGCSSRAVFCSFFGCFLTKRSRDQPETAPDRGTDQQNRRSDPLQSWSSIPLQVKSVCAGIFQIFVVCWSKGWIIDKQVDIVKRYCQSAVDMNPERPDWPTRRHCFVLWPCYIQNVTRSELKLHHSACSCPRRLRVWGRSKFTKHSLTLQEKALLFFFWISHCMLAVGDLDLVATFSELSLGCSDCRV